ncbi:hypothetical protein FHE66_07305 [Georgenia sp. 311]|uniref:hypothetical protein n=1 Tax=Georgenia sp. 311 TaxID=2585134 RepID=UPI00111268FE|nr:hypothetical protein [Georgenia sp. 311]TNC18247.1 hypothetical protein FHE66_07305 [Georgenia sp. 311]
MTRRLILPAVLLIGLAGCSSTTSDDDATSAETTTATEQTVEQETCAGFYEGTGTPLAERATNARAALSGGEVVDAATYTEINALEQRITELGRDAPEEMVTLLEEVNAPFTEAVATVNESRTAEVPEDEEPAFPDLTQIDVTASETAQGELETVCADAGYGD